MCARTFTGLTHDFDPTMVCDPNGCLSSVLPVTLDEGIRRQIIQRLPAWRTVPAVLSAPSHNLTTHVGTSFQIRTTSQQNTHVWVSMKADRIDQWRFSVVAVSDDLLAKEACGFHLVIPGVSVRKPFLGAKTKMRTRSAYGTDCPSCPRQQNRETRDADMHVQESAPSGLTLHCALEPPYACLSMLALLEKGLPFKECFISLLDGKQRHPAYLAVNPHGKEPVMVCRTSLGTGGNEEVVLCKLTVIDSWLEDDDQNLRATVTRKNREEPDLENLFGIITRVTDTGRQGDETTGAGNGADGEGTPAAKRVGHQRRRARGLWTGDDHWPNQVPERRLRCYVRYHELVPRPHGWRQVRAWLRDQRREEDINALISSLHWCCGSRVPFASDSVTELVDRSLPTFAIPGQRVAFLKLLRGRGVYDTRDGGLSLASFRSVSKISMPTTTAGSHRVETVVTGETHQYLENGMERLLRSRQ